MISNYCINRTFFGQYFWCYVIRCSTQGSLPFSIVINFGSQSKITQFDLKYWEREINKKLFRENYVTKNCTKLNIKLVFDQLTSMLSFKKIFPSLRSLWIILLSWRYLTPRRICFMKYLVSGSVMAFRLLCNSIRLRRRHSSKMMYTKSWNRKWYWNVRYWWYYGERRSWNCFDQAYLVFKVGIQFYYIRMIQSFVKGYFLSHFFSLMLFDQEWFGNNFSSNHWWVLNCHISEFVTFCESSLKRKKGISAISLQLDLSNMFFILRRFPRCIAKNEITFPRNRPRSYFLWVGLDSSFISSGISFWSAVLVFELILNGLSSNCI